VISVSPGVTDSTDELDFEDAEPQADKGSPAANKQSGMSVAKACFFFMILFSFRLRL
jgi:hypothetical protein